MSFPDIAYVVTLSVIVWEAWQMQVDSDSAQLADPAKSLPPVWHVLSDRVVPLSSPKQTSPNAKDSTNWKDSLLLTDGDA